MAQRLKTDWILFSTVVLMVLFGALMIYSASSVVAQMRMGASYYFLVRQLIWIAIAIPLMMFMKRLNYRKLQTPAVAFTAMGLVMILLAVVYFADPRQHRWIRFGPFGGLQPSEFAKPALALFLAYFIALRSRAINSRYTLLPAFLALGFVTMAVVVADLGTALVLVGTAAVVFFVAGLESRYIVIAFILGIVGCVAAVAAKPYRLARVVSYVDPQFKTVDKFDKHGWIRSQMKKSITARDTNYQSEQAKIAVGSGGPIGVGLMQGRQKLFYLPEAHTDTIYAVVGEEFGLFGSAGLLLGFVVILWRGIRATVLIPDEFGRYLALGVTTMLVIQAFFNMSVVLGMVPTKGIPLPMISFGGSSLLVTLASLGILLNVAEHAG
ncbi:MAG TPA: putative peptidoglycan glycosyltransferase FtsW [Bryobacteraceae bacterium]|jgi:cell division protein FtsW|nr:putative peptidoglycan glycosyltransferase FtsW [Bryobacteraceae bacterium]